MHYYQFNIKDYSFATIRMTLMEDLAFRRMLDVYYETEKPLPCELKRVSKLIGMMDYQEEVRSMLNEFWTETELGWVNDRAEKEITIYQAKADTARANGKLGGRPKKPTETQSVNLANPEESESKANHKPITNNHNIPYQLIVDAYHEFLPELAGVKLLNDSRKKAIKSRWLSKLDKVNTIEFWNRYFNYVRTSDFLMGKKTDWSANFDFLIKEANLLKTIEGVYDNAK